MDDDEDFFTPDEAFMAALAPQPYVRRFRRADLIVLGLGLIYGLSEAVTTTLATAHDLAAGHANFQIQRDAFHEEAALELESLIAGDDEDGE